MDGLQIFRLVVVLLLGACTICLTCSSLFPLFRQYTYNYINGDVTRITYYYWYVENTKMNWGTVYSSVRQYMRDAPCGAMRGYYVAACVFSVIATALCGLATLIGAAWVSVGYSVVLSVMIFILSAISFVCATTVLGLMATAYHRDICTTDEVMYLSLSEADFKRVEGFILMAIGMAGVTVATLLQAVGFFLGLMTGKREGSRSGSEEAQREPAVNCMHHTDSNMSDRVDRGEEMKEGNFQSPSHSGSQNPYSRAA